MRKQRKTILFLITTLCLCYCTTIKVQAEEKTEQPIINETISSNEIPEIEGTNQTVEIQTPNVTTPTAATIYELSPEVIAYCKAASAEFSTNEYILEALIFTESRGNSEAKNGKHVGLTQLNPAYFTDVMTLLNITSPTDPQSNIRICAYQLAQWSAKYDNNIYLILDCWHKGEGKAIAQFNEKGNSYNKKICENAMLLAANEYKDIKEEVLLPPTDDTES